MADGGGGATGNSRSSAPLDGAFLLQLLRKPPQTQHQHQPSSSSSSFPPHQTLNNDPAVAAVGPTNSSFLIRPHSPQETLLHRHHFSPPLSQPPPGFNRRAAPPGFPHHPSPPPPPPSSSHFSGSPQVFRGDHPLGAPAIHGAHPPPLANSHFSASPPAAFSARDFGGNSSSTSRKGGLGSRAAQSNVDDNSAESSYYWQKSQHSMQPPHHHTVSSGNFRNVVAQRQDVVERQDGKQQNVGRGELNRRQGNGQSLLQRELMGKHGVGGGNGKGFINGERFFNEGDGLGSKRGDIEDRDDLVEEFEELMVTGESSVEKRSNSSRAKDVRLDLYRGHYVSSQRLRIRKREMECRYDIDSFTPLFLSIYKSLIPADEEKRKQIQLLLSLAKLVNKEWPHAQLHLYGSCANSFGVSNSDIDICLAIDDSNMSKSDILLKLADILESDNLQNVQALTHARVPIVKMMDPVTGISCDICINNLLAVANTKLLRDYAQIDDRLRQLAFIVKHWAKSRGVNETYRGTLSSYAYVLMCIHYLQMRKPAILPCLQSMQPTYAVTLDGTRCAYFDQVDRLRNFGAQNNESISRLLWGFFHYWAYFHDYMNDVISVRTGQIISKRKKDWTRRIGNDRHLICIEDPFEVSHDLGRVVDKFSIKILREEFERAADILQYDRNPSVTLFEPYVPRSMQNELLSD